MRQCFRRFGTHSSTSLEPRPNTQHPGAVSVVPVAAGTEPDQPLGILLELLGAVRLLLQAEECWQQPRQRYCQHRTSTVICACSDLRVRAHAVEHCTRRELTVFSYTCSAISHIMRGDGPLSYSLLPNLAVHLLGQCINCCTQFSVVLSSLLFLGFLPFMLLGPLGPAITVVAGQFRVCAYRGRRLVVHTAAPLALSQSYPSLIRALACLHRDRCQTSVHLGLPDLLYWFAASVAACPRI